MKSEKFTPEQLKKFGFRLPEKLPFTGFGIHKLTISEVRDHGDHVELFAIPSERYTEDSYITVEGSGRINHCVVVFSTERNYATLTAEGSRIYKTVRGTDEFVRIFKGDFASGSVSEIRHDVQLIGVSILSKAFDLFKVYGGRYARADYKVVKPVDFRSNPHLELTGVWKADGLKF